MQVRVRGLGSLTRHARNRPSKGHPAPALRDAKGILTKIVSEPNASKKTSLWRDD